MVCLVNISHLQVSILSGVGVLVGMYEKHPFILSGIVM
jgi:hypothetical protein